MKLNEKTLAVLTNFASIQPNILIEKGNKVRTIAEAMNIMAEAELDQDFPSKFVIYDLGEFLSTINLLDEPDLTFKDDHVLITGGGGRIRVRYFYSSEEVITTVKKSVAAPSVDVTVDLSKENLDKIRQASGVLGHEMVVVRNNEDGATALVTVTYPSDSTSNEFTIEVPAVYDEDANFSFIMNIKNLKVIPGDYRVEMSRKFLASFQNTTSANVHYFIAMEKTSKYGE